MGNPDPILEAFRNGTLSVDVADDLEAAWIAQRVAEAVASLCEPVVEVPQDVLEGLIEGWESSNGRAG